MKISTTVIDTKNNQIAENNKKISALKIDLKTAEDARDAFEYESTEQEFDQFIDETCEEVEIMGGTYAASMALKEVDPTAYRCAKNDYDAGYDLDDSEEYTQLCDSVTEIEDQIEDLENENEDLQCEIEELEENEE